MKKHFWKIVSAAVAASIALSLSANSVLADNFDAVGKSSEPSTFTVVNDNNESFVATDEMLEQHEKYVMAFMKEYEKALDEELSKIDRDKFINDIATSDNFEDPYVAARDTAYDIAGERCKAKGLDPVPGLEPTKMTVNSAQAKAPTGETANVSVYDIEKTKYPANTAKIYAVAGGNSGTMKVEENFAGNYKHITVQLIYENGTVSSKTVSSNEQEFSCTVPYKQNCGKLVKAIYVFCLYSGTGSGAGLLDFVRVTFTLKQ